MTSRLQSAWPGLAGASLAAGLGWFLLHTGFGLGWQQASYDFPFVLKPVRPPDEVVIVHLDDESAGRLDQPAGRPWNRALHGQLLRRLTADGARLVVYDIFFAGPGPEGAADEALAAAIRDHGRVVLAANPIAFGLDDRSTVRGRSIQPPFEPLAAAAAGIGSAEMNPDDDLIVRRHLPVTSDDLVPSLAWAAAEVAGLPVTRTARGGSEARWMNYYGPARSLPNHTFWRALSTNVAEGGLAPGTFKDKVVFVGGVFQTQTAGDRRDEFATPHTRWMLRQERFARGRHFISGVEVHATAFLNLMRADWLGRATPGVEAVWIGLVGWLAGWGLVRLRPAAATGTAFGAVVVCGVAGCLIPIRWGAWFPWLIPALAVVPAAWAWAILYNSIRFYVEKRLFEQSLALYLPPPLVKKFAGRPELLRTGAEKQVLTILFSDIADFTRLSEGMDSDDLARLINAYFDRAIPNCIFKTDGTVMKYIGDAIFAVWNAPDPQPDHAARACRAALLLRDEMTGPSSPARVPLRTRIGLHTGWANIGNFGSRDRFGYDAIGESINLASRIEGLNKHLGTDVLITGATAGLVGDMFVTRRLGTFRLKGFEKAVEVYELIDLAAGALSSKPWRDEFARGLAGFEQGAMDEAGRAFRSVLERRLGDGPSRFYLERIEEAGAHPRAEGWSPVIEIGEK